MFKWIFFFCLLPSVSVAQIRNNTYFFDKGDSLDKLEKYESAIWYYTRSIAEHENDSIDVYYFRGFCNYNLKNYLGAIQDFEKYVQKVNGKEYDTSMDVRGFRSDMVQLSYAFSGYSYFMIGNKEAACECFNKAGQFGYRKAYEIIKRECN